MKFLKNFFKGWASALTIIPPDKFPRIERPEFLEMSDEEALKKDWEQVGKDIEESIKRWADLRYGQGAEEYDPAIYIDNKKLSPLPEKDRNALRKYCEIE